MLLNFFTGVVSSLFRTWVVSLGWSWFLTPLGLANPGFLVILGILFLLTAVRGLSLSDTREAMRQADAISEAEKREISMQNFTGMLMSIIVTFMMLVMMFIVHLLTLL